MKKTIFMALATIILMLTSCSSTSDVPCTVMQHYFINNNVTAEPPTVITTQQDFARYFGMATVMGPDGQPTDVDFTEHFVVCVSKPETNVYTDLSLVSAKQSGTTLTVRCRAKEGDIQSYTMHPLLLLRFDNKYKGHDVQVSFQ